MSWPVPLGPEEQNLSFNNITFANVIVYDEIRYSDWQHILLVSLGAGLFAAGLLVIIVRYISNRAPQWITKLSKRQSHSQHTPRSTFGRRNRQKIAVPDLTTSFEKIKAFSFHTYDPLERDAPQEDANMHIISISEEKVAREVLSRAGTPLIRTRCNTPEGRPAVLSRSSTQVIFGSVNLARLSIDGASRRSDISSLRADLINEYRLEQGLNGLILCHKPGDSTASTSRILQQFREQLIPIVLQAEADSDLWDVLDYNLVDGVVVENACIQSDGARRDFFRAARVRDVAAQCKEHRKTRASFFFAFLETYQVVPSAAVLRRAYKLADFFGALLEVRSADPGAAPIRDMPLSAFDALKNADITWLQKSWAKCVSFGNEAVPTSPISPTDGTFDLDLSAVYQVIPDTYNLLRSHDVDRRSSMRQGVSLLHAPDYISDLPQRRSIWDYTSCGTPLSLDGCFAMREEIVQEQYNLILKMQKSLKERRMLQLYGEAEVLRVSQVLKDLANTTAYPDCLRELIGGFASGNIKILAGLDSGFTLPDAGGQIWGLIDSTLEEEGRLDIHISLRASSDVATIWHVFLAHRGVPRIERFQEEVLLNKIPSILPLSLAKELETSAESELLYLMQQIQMSNTEHPFQDEIITRASRLLLQETTRQAWVALHSRACLDSSLSMRSLIERRLTYHAQLGATQLPSIDGLCAMHKALEAELGRALLYSDRETMSKLSSGLAQAYGHAGKTFEVTPVADLYGLIYFCALRKLAFENVYLETTDRCPFFLSQPDQAAVFSELWVLGSQCEIYFGILPRALGEITYNQYRQHLAQNPPPVSSWDGKEVFTAYGTPPPRVKAISSLTGKLPEQSEEEQAENPKGPPKPAKYREALRQVGALSIFCVPAIVDVALLCFVGRGLYISAWLFDKSNDQSLYANYGILTALILTGGITGWVGSSGGFYLFNHAFDNMVHFLIHRFAGAMMITSTVAILGLIGFGLGSQPNSWYSGAVFVLYLYPLSIFLTLLGIFATMHRSDSPLPSGRMSMWKCLPILLISPIVTCFVKGWDLLIYMLVIYTFTLALIFEFRRLCHAWTNWHLKVPAPLKEGDLLKWFKEQKPEAKELDSIALAAAARSALFDGLSTLKEQQSKWFKKPIPDPFVAKISNGLPESMFLLKKECAGTEMPEMFTTTWFVQLELALNNQRQLMRGLREHSAFINYRYSKYDIGQNIGLFLAALLDRIVAIIMSARRPTHDVQDLYVQSTRNRYAISFALLYFLCGALTVDIVLQRYWAFASQVSTKRLGSVEDMEAVLLDQKRAHQRRYWKAVIELACLLLMILGVATIMLWLFVWETNDIIFFFTYVSSYTAVILCQFHRCFTKSHRMHVITVFVCCAIGLVVGIILRAVPYTADWPFDFVVAQNIACVSALVGTAYWIFHNPDLSGKNLAAKENEFNASADIPRSAASHGDGKCDGVHSINKQILDHICLGLDVNVTWSGLHEDVRKLIVGRLLGHSTALTAIAKSWAASQKINIEGHDNELRACLHNKDDDMTALPVVASKESRYELTSQYVRVAPVKTVIVRAVGSMMRGLDNFVKWTAIISGGTPDAPRELWYALRASRMRFVILWVLLKIWKLCWYVRIGMVHMLAITGKPTLGSLLDLIFSGARRTLRGNTITVNAPTWKVTGFVARSPLKQLGMIIYEGIHTKAPAQKRPIAVNFYDEQQRLRRRQDIRGPTEKPLETTYTYLEKSPSRWPLCKSTIDGKVELRTNYDSWGRPMSGEVIRGEVRWDFQYFYKKGMSSDSEVLHATYQRIDGRTSDSISVFWCVRPRTTTDDVNEWNASDKVQSVLAVINNQTYDIRWVYKHAQGAEIQASVLDPRGKRKPCLPPAEILEDKYKFLQKPKDVSFDHEDLLVYHPRSVLERMCRFKPGVFSKLYTKVTSIPPLRWLHLGEHVIFHKLSTATLRTALWTAWGKAPFIDAVTASVLDELILRKEPLLKKYWRLRDAGYLTQAAFTLDENLEQIISAMEPSHESSDKCPLLIKSADLFTMGLGKDTTQLTARLEDAYRDTEQTTSVIFSDNGCWPDNPGGVSNCRRDLVNGHTTIRGHCLAESANDYGIPRYQIERNINTLKVMPLWGLDSKTANHGLFDNLLQTQVDNKIAATKLDEDIRQVFVPLLRAFILGARSRRYTRKDLVEYSNVMLKMNKYFEMCDYNKTWNSEIVWKAWVEGWLHDYKDPNVRSSSECFDLEQPSLSDFRDALNLYICYFFIYSVQMPEDCPKVFQSTHHGISSLFGMLLKYRRGTTWGLWDHAILWRETCLNISPAQCLLPLPVQSMLLAGVRLACHLAYTHVDIVLPCTSVFNPDWEADLGTDQGLRGSKKLFQRKIDPIVNGIGNMDSFKPVEVVRSKLPTTVMLSNVQFIKDVKTAVLAADVIINKFGFKDYRLIIYGAQDRQPSYALETVNLINSRGLAGKVILGGFGSPKEVLKDAWLFVNSSLSEGLPLAIGEAALSGVPIVATEVGATSLVLTDPDDSTTRYGEVVPPNDPESLARAQLSILSMTGPWAKYTKSGETCKLPDVFNADLVKQFTERMYAKADDRRALGLRLREVVLRSFHGHRYLREHEQMYWIQRRQAEIRRSPLAVERHPAVDEIYGEKRVFKYDRDADNIEEANMRWQTFDMESFRRKKGLLQATKDELEIPHPIVVELGEK